MKQRKKFRTKTLALLLAIVVLITSIPFTVFAQNTLARDSSLTTEWPFCDQIFRQFVIENYDTNNDGILSDEEAEAVTTMNVNNLEITNLSGIEVFTNLEVLDCSNNKLNSLEIQALVNLKELYCDNNSIAYINAPQNNQIKVLNIAGNNISGWFNFGQFSNLEVFDCSNNNLDGLNIGNLQNLKELYCQNNNLQYGISISQNTKLETLNCSNNNMQYLDVSSNVNLVNLTCSQNKLYDLNLSNNTKLESFKFVNNIIDIGVPDEKYCLDKLMDKGFNVYKIVSIEGATLETGSDGKYYLYDFTPVNGKLQVKITSDVGNGTLATFILSYSLLSDGNGEELAGYTLSLKGCIEVNFYMELSEIVAHEQTAYMLFTFSNGDVKKVYVKDAQIKTVKGQEYYVFSCEVSAKEMTCDITAQLFVANECGKEYTYNVKEYAEYILKYENDLDEFKDATEIVKSMLNYGGYAQLYFDYRKHDLAHTSEFITKEDLQSITQVVAEDLEQYSISYEQANYFANFKGTNIGLFSKTKLRMYFTFSEIADLDNLSFTCDGKTLDYVKSNDLYYVEITDISAQDLDKFYTVTVSDGQHTLNAKFSVMTYCYNVLSRPTTATRTQELKNTVAALYLYNQAANLYFGE